MRERGWVGGPIDLRRQKRENQRKTRQDKLKKRFGEWNRIGHLLGMNKHWWNVRSTRNLDLAEDYDYMSASDDEDDHGDEVTPDEELVSFPRLHTA